MIDKVVFDVEGVYRAEVTGASSVEHVKATNISSVTSTYALNSQYI